MQLVKLNPVRDMFSLRNRMNHIFDDLFYPINRDEGELSMGRWNPVVDVYDNDDSVVIKAELPGIEKEDIEIDVKDRVLTLKGERSSENEVKDDNYYRRERCFGKFERAFTLPADVDPDKIKADYKDGVLKIDIPKPEEKKPRQITIH
jgi:HSP20 family protein